MGRESRLEPGVVDLAPKLMVMSQFKQEPKRKRPNPLWQAGADGNIEGDQTGRSSTYTAAILHLAVAASVAGAVAVGLGLLLRRR